MKMQWELYLPVSVLVSQLLVLHVLPANGHITYIEAKYPLQVCCYV